MFFFKIFWFWSIFVVVKCLKLSLAICFCCYGKVIAEDAEHTIEPVVSQAEQTSQEDLTRVYKATESSDKEAETDMDPLLADLPNLLNPEPEPLPKLKNQGELDAQFKYLVGIYLKSARGLEAAVRSGAEKRVLDIHVAEMRSNWDSLDAYGWPDAADERLRLSLVACSEAWELYYWVRLARLSYRKVPIDGNMFYYRKAENLLEFLARWDKDLAREMQNEEVFMQNEAPFHDVARKLDAEIIASLTNSVEVLNKIKDN